MRRRALGGDVTVLTYEATGRRGGDAGDLTYRAQCSTIYRGKTLVHHHQTAVQEPGAAG